MCTDNETPPSILGRVTDRHPKAASTASLACWLAAIAVLALHANGLAVRSADAFMLADSWLIGLGCVGAPVLVFGFLGRHLSPRALELVAAVCFTGAIATTVFVGAGQAHLNAWTACYVLILFLALGIHALNGAYVLDRRNQIAHQVRAGERAERDKDVRAAYLGALMDARQAQQRHSEEIEKLLEMPTEELIGLSAALADEVEIRRARHLKNLPGRNTGRILQLFKGDGLPPTGSDPDQA